MPSRSTITVRGYIVFWPKTETVVIFLAFSRVDCMRKVGDMPRCLISQRRSREREREGGRGGEGGRGRGERRVGDFM